MEDMFTVLTLLSLFEGSLLLALVASVMRAEGWAADRLFSVVILTAALLSLSQTIFYASPLPEIAAFWLFNFLHYGTLAAYAILARRWLTRTGGPLLFSLIGFVSIAITRPDRDFISTLLFAGNVAVLLFLARVALIRPEGKERGMQRTKRLGMVLYWSSSAAGLILVWLWGDGTISGTVIPTMLAGIVNSLVLLALLIRVQLEGSREPTALAAQVTDHDSDRVSLRE